MGLDITVLGKPYAGNESEFHELLHDLSIANGVMKDDRPRPSLWKRLFSTGRSKMTQADLAAKTDRFNAIAAPPFATVGAPVVGQDAVADAWLIEMASTAGREPEQALAEMAGYHVLELVQDCDGLPVYTHGEFGQDVDKTSFRGAFLELCTAVLPASEIAAAWEVMTAPDLLSYGERLATHARRFADERGLVAQLGQRALDWDDHASPAAQLHIVDSLARWAIFWGSRGHGAYPYF